MKKTFLFIGLFILVSKANAKGLWETNQPNSLEMSEIKEEIKCSDKTCITTIVIPDNYNKDIVNIVPSVFKGNNLSVPGTTYEYIFNIINESNYEYKYKTNSFYVSPSNSDNNYKNIVGFNNEAIPKNVKSYRISTSEPLMYLYDGKKLNEIQLSDTEIIKRLVYYGYKNNIEELDNYYIDYFNKNYNTNYTSLNDLDSIYINKIWPNINEYPTTLETNLSLIELYYNYFYNNLLTLKYKDKTDLDNNTYTIGQYLKENIYNKLNEQLNNITILSKQEQQLDSFYLHLNELLTDKSFALFNFGLDLAFSLERANNYGNINIYYINTLGDYISDNEVISGIIGTPYEINRKDYLGYKLVRVDGNESGTFTKEDIDLYYMYDNATIDTKTTFNEEVKTGINSNNNLIYSIITLIGLIIMGIRK